MNRSIKQYALLGCATFVVSGCAIQQNAAPEYRLSSSAQAISPGSSMLQRGRAQLDAGLDALAIEAFRAEIRVNPESADAYNGLAVAYGRIGRGDLAQRYFETALAKEPGNIKAQTNLARLTGDTVPVIKFADVGVAGSSHEPVTVTAVVQDQPSGQRIENVDAPAFAPAIVAPQPTKLSATPEYALAKQGVLSTRYAVAPARIATLAGLIKEPRPTPPLAPLPSPPPPLPLASLPADYRASGTRLVRVSLGEVHLITRSAPPAKAIATQSEFRSFGARLETWLPQSIAVEQARAGKAIQETSVLMAAIERAEQHQKIAASNEIDLPEMPEFAYLGFKSGEPAANA